MQSTSIQALHKWGLKRYSCCVQYYTEEPLSDLDFVICSLLATTEDGAYDKRSLGIMLGFSMADNQPEAYYDKSEVKLYEDILAIVEKNHLIRVNEDFVEAYQSWTTISGKQYFLPFL